MHTNHGHGPGLSLQIHIVTHQLGEVSIKGYPRQLQQYQLVWLNTSAESFSKPQGCLDVPMLDHDNIFSVYCNC